GPLGRIDIVEKNGTGEYLYVESLAGIIGLVQMGTLELHVWNCRVDRLEFPDQFIIDLDPAADVKWDFVVETAHAMRARLQELGLESFVKTTGGKGLHLVVPLARRQGWDEVYEFTRRFVLDY